MYFAHVHECEQYTSSIIYQPLTEGAGWSENKPSIYLEYLDMVFRSYKLLFSKGKIYIS